jgi:hypothetical protein
MRIIFLCISLIISLSATATAAPRVTCYRNGTLYQQTMAATKSSIEVRLPAGYLENTLSISPATGTTIVGVEFSTSVPADRAANQRDTLMEQRRQLEDRLLALETREAIFTAAAKSQSGKAPRKTKTNPDPLQGIRQGTDFAIAQLEAVYTARRKTTQEIRKIDAQLASGKNSSAAASRIAHIRVTPAKGSVTVRYATIERAWRPVYNLYLDGSNFARLELNAQLAPELKAAQTSVSLLSLEESDAANSRSMAASTSPLATYPVSVTAERSLAGVYNRFSGTLRNTTATYLPPGDASLFRNGTYLGKFRFDGLSSGRSGAVSVGF